VTGWEVPPKKKPFRGSKALIRIESSYYYDPFGRRLWKEINGVRTYFVYADEGLIAEVDAAGNVIKSYGYKPGSTWTTDPLFMKVGGQYYFYQNDHLGTPQKLTAVNGAVVWAAKYSSFGEADVDISSSIVNNLRFPGQYFDQETGLHYNWHRFYNPATGRYLRLDPIGIKGGINWYSYALNNPKAILDPLGLMGRKPPTYVFYDIFSKKFLNDLRETNPVEYFLFEQYAKSRPINHWPTYMYSDRPLDEAMLLIEVEYFIEEWQGFDCYAKKHAPGVLGKKALKFYISQYGFLSLVGKAIKDVIISIFSDITTAEDAAELVKISAEVSALSTIGPAVINEENFFGDHGYAGIHLLYLKMEIEKLKRK